MKRCLGCMAKLQENEKVCPVCGYSEDTGVKEAYYLLPGTIIHGKYLVGKVLGYGGFGVTYVGWDLQLDRKVAVKEYLPSDFATRSYGTVQLTIFSGEATVQFESGLKSFIAEARRLARFNRVPEIVDIYDCFMENDTGYIIMEYLEGKDVKTLLREKGIFPVDEAVDIIRHVLHGLIDVHKEGIIHRDIAPDNVFITKDGEVKILDFGASRYATAVQSRSLSVILKPGYAPEEQYRSRGQQGPWTDVYAAAATFYRMITGKRPKEAIERLAEDDLQKPSEMGIVLPENVETAMMNALNVRQEYRTKDAESFYNELKSEQVERVVEQVVVEKAGIPIPVIAAIAAAAVAIVVGIGFFAASQSGAFDKKINQEQKASLSQDECYVPDITNKTRQEAEKVLAEESLQLKIVNVGYSEFIQKDNILKQQPGSGAVVKKNNFVQVTMSGGKEITMLSGIIGQMTEDEALEEIAAKRLSADKKDVREVFSDIYGPGVVVDLSVKEDTELEIGTQVQLTVSKGKESDSYKDLAVPKLKGKTLKQVEKILKKLQKKSGGFTFAITKIKKKYSDKVRKGAVIRQNLKAGTTVNTKNGFELVISKGVEKVEVPEVRYNMTGDDAVRALKKAGLKAEVVESYDSSVEKGYVSAQSPSAGSQIKKGSTVTITVSRGEEPVQTQQSEPDPSYNNSSNSNSSNSNSSNSNSSNSNSSSKEKSKSDSGKKKDDDGGLRLDDDDDEGLRLDDDDDEGLRLVD